VECHGEVCLQLDVVELSISVATSRVVKCGDGLCNKLWVVVMYSIRRLDHLLEVVGSVFCSLYRHKLMPCSKDR
jgi:hypothetical protein